MMRAFGLGVPFLLILGDGLAVAGAATSEEKSWSSAANDKGEISLPKDFRARFSHLGSWFVPEGDASGFHDVYAEDSTVKAYRDTGKFPDGAVLVKELRPHKAGNYSTGNGVGRATSEIKQWFVMVKDTTNRFPGNPNWGDGWGWGLFKPDAPQKNVSSGYQADCLGCHVPAKATDWVYTEAYPTLR